MKKLIILIPLSLVLLVGCSSSIMSVTPGSAPPSDNPSGMLQPEESGGNPQAGMPEGGSSSSGTITILLFIAMAGFFGFAMWYRRNKKGKKVLRGNKGDLFIKLVYEAVGEKKPPARFWPEPFRSIQGVEAWWNSREDLWKGVEKIELANR